MNESFENQAEQNDDDQSVKRYEKMLRENQSLFFDVDEFEDLIDHYLETGESKKALQAVEMGCEQHPSSFTLLLYKAQILASSHKPFKALEVLAKIELVEPNNLDLHLIKASIHSQLREYRKAIESYHTCLKLASDSEKEDLYVSLAFEYENLENYKTAIKYLKKTLKLNPENDTALYEIGFCYDFKDAYEEGIAFYKNFIEEHPYAHSAWYNMGLLYNKLELYEKAISSFDFSLVIEESFSSAWFNKGISYSKLGMMHKAIESYKKTIEIDDADGTSYYQIATCYEALEEKEHALNYYHKAIAADPYLSDAFMNLGFLYEELDRLNEGIHYIKRAVDIDPQHPDYLLAYGSLQIRMGFHTEGLEAFEEVIRMREEHPLVWSLYTHGLYVSGEIDESFAVILKAIEKYPRNPANYYILAANLFREGRRTEALMELEKGLTLSPEDHERFLNFYPSGVNDLDILELISKYSK